MRQRIKTYEYVTHKNRKKCLLLGVTNRVLTQYCSDNVRDDHFSPCNSVILSRVCPALLEYTLHMHNIGGKGHVAACSIQSSHNIMKPESEECERIINLPLIIFPVWTQCTHCLPPKLAVGSLRLTLCSFLPPIFLIGELRPPPRLWEAVKRGADPARLSRAVQKVSILHPPPPLHSFRGVWTRVKPITVSDPRDDTQS